MRGTGWMVRRKASIVPLLLLALGLAGTVAGCSFLKWSAGDVPNDTTAVFQRWNPEKPGTSELDTSQPSDVATGAVVYLNGRSEFVPSSITGLEPGDVVRLHRDRPDDGWALVEKVR